MDVSGRENIVRQECADDDRANSEADDRRQVIDTIAIEAVSLLSESRNNVESHGYLSKPEAISQERIDAIVGQRIGGYLVVGWDGDCETSAVFRATRLDDPTQHVAIKVIKYHVNSSAILKRFHADLRVRNALARHPNIMPFLDAGTTDDGLLYFVTEHIDGLPIDQYCDQNGLTVSARLKLFFQVCEAVQFLHKHAFMHKALKPSNILVAADGIPRLFELGLAVWIPTEMDVPDADTGTRAILTGTADLMVPPEYASPEQVRGELVTTATDVYALGVVLYELLSGRYPYWTGNGSTDEIFQAICDQVPEKPSTAVSRSLADQPGAHEIARLRGMTAPQLIRSLTGDLDAIVLMAMRKEPEWRYTSTEQLSEDLRRHLRGLPLLAHRDTILYRTNRFIARNVWATAAALTVLLALVSGVIGTTTGLVMARRQRERAERSFHEASQTVDTLFTRINDEQILKEPGLGALRKGMLESTRRFFESFLEEQATDQTSSAETAKAHARLAEINGLTGSVASAITEYEKAITLWESLVTAQPGNKLYQTNLAQTLGRFGTALLQDGRLDEALDRFQQARLLVESLVAVNPGSVPLHTELSVILLNIAEIQRRQDKPDAAVASLERVLAIRSQLVPEQLDSFELRIALATAYSSLGRLMGMQTDQWLEATTAYAQAIELREAITREHPELADQAHRLATELSDLSNLQQKMGQFDRALENRRQALTILERITQTYPNISDYQAGLGSTYQVLSELQSRRGERTDALTFAQKGRSLFEHLVAENPKKNSFRRELGKNCNSLGRLLAQTGDPTEALRMFQRSVDLVESLPQPDSEDSYDLACNAALCIPLIGLKTHLPGTQHALTRSDQVRRQRYGDRAIEALRRSASGGFVNAEMLQNDTNLDAIRTRADFQALMKEIEEKPLTTGK